MKKIAYVVIAVLAFAGCRDQKGETPNENYEMNHVEEVDNTSTATDTMTHNSTQTDPAVTD